MRYFNVKFNKLLESNPVASAPTDDNKKTFYNSSMPPILGCHIRRENIGNLQVP